VPDRVDTSAAATVGAALRRVSYDESAVERLLGEDSWSTAIDDAEAHERRLPRTATAAAIRLFFLERPVARDDAEGALGARTVNALARANLARVDKQTVEPLARIAPVGPILLASDRLSTDPTRDPADYVSTYSPTARLCDLLTPRPWVSRALDVGTGNGVQALLAASHSEHVVATDVNPRALAFTELNAALSGIDNVETRNGSLFEPVGDERFDLIVCNPPFVISPERRWTYRDGWLEGDELSAQVVRETAAHLADGGYATILASWLGRNSNAPDEHVWDWVQGIGCDAWVLPVDEASPREHAERWNVHLANDREAHRDAVRRWVAYVKDLGAGVVTEGAILLHRRDGHNTARIDEVDEDQLDAADHQIRRAFAARATLDGHDVLDAQLEPVETLRVEKLSRRARVTLEEGIWSELDVSLGAAALLGKLDGRPLRELRPTDAAVASCRELLELGAFEVRATSAP
jgi:methylase of polypeptide subunit release factors